MDEDHVLLDHLDIEDVARSIRVDAGALFEEVAPGLHGANEGLTDMHKAHDDVSEAVVLWELKRAKTAILDDDGELTQSGHRE